MARRGSWRCFPHGEGGLTPGGWACGNRAARATAAVAAAILPARDAGCVPLCGRPCAFAANRKAGSRGSERPECPPRPTRVRLDSTEERRLSEERLRWIGRRMPRAGPVVRSAQYASHGATGRDGRMSIPTPGNVQEQSGRPESSRKWRWRLGRPRSTSGVWRCGRGLCRLRDGPALAAGCDATAGE